MNQIKSEYSRGPKKFPLLAKFWWEKFNAWVPTYPPQSASGANFMRGGANSMRSGANSVRGGANSVRGGVVQGCPGFPGCPGANFYPIVANILYRKYFFPHVCAYAKNYPYYPLRAETRHQIFILQFFCRKYFVSHF